MEKLIIWAKKNNYSFEIIGNTTPDGFTPTGILIPTHYEGVYPSDYVYMIHNLIMKACSRNGWKYTPQPMKTCAYINF